MITAVKIAQSTLLVTLIASSLPASASDATHGKSICTVRNADAAMLRMVPAEVPAIAQMQGLSGTAMVQFDLEKNGVAHNAVIVQSTGYGLLDSAAQKAALAQTYAPETHDCRTVDGTYRVWVVFER